MTNSKSYAQNFTPTFTTSKESTHKISDKQEYVFGYLEVLEDRTKPQGKTIQLPIYIFKSRSKTPKKDPIIYTVGGPGSSTMRSAQYMKYYKYLDDRDFILFEQRGTQFAKPSLDCPEWSEAIYKSKLPDFDENQKPRLFEKAAKKCRENLIAQNIDLNSYNTNAIAADINDLVTTLNFEKYNFLSISYSTKIAQVLIRDYPEKLRSVIMDSPLPLNVNYDEESITNLMQTINNLLLKCESDTKCNRAFPDIKNRFFSYLKETTKQPLKVEVKHGKENELATFYLKGKDLASLFSSTNTASFPFEINEVLNGNLKTIKESLIQALKKPSQFYGTGKGMRLSVWCSEEYPFVSNKKVAIEKNKYQEVLGLSPMVFEANICECWNVKSVSAIENLAIKSNIPVLITSGEFDNETPVKWATSMLSDFSNGYHFIFKGWGHAVTTNWSNTCGMQIANDFFNNPNTRPISKCFNEIKEIDFKTE